MAEPWSTIHDFMRGWGLHSKGVETVHEDHPGVPGHRIPYRVVTETGGRTLYAKDVKRLLQKNLFQVDASELDDLYLALQPLLEAERQKRAALPPVKFDRITIPRFTKEVPPMFDIREVLSAQPLTGDPETKRRP